MRHSVLCVLMVLLFPSSWCFGNLSGPWKPGQLIVDVTGVKDVAIVRERLRIDLQPLEQGGWIRITATYVIDHTQAPRDLPLSFITGVRSVQGVKCSLNGMPLGFSKVQVVIMPESWKPPTATPGFVPEEELLYSRSITDTQHEWIVFSVPLQTGRQSIEVTYEVEPGAYYSERYAAKFWQTAYILAPARTWKSFGGLELEVLAPDNWQVKCNVPLVNQGRQWTASFDSLPADFIALTTVHPNNRRIFSIDLKQSLYLLGIVIVLVGLSQMRNRYRRAKHNMNIIDQPENKHWFEGLLFLLLYFLPLVWNMAAIGIAKFDLPDSQNNYQMFVIFVMFQGLLWLTVLAPLMLLSRLFFWLLRLLGTWLGNRSMKLNAG